MTTRERVRAKPAAVKIVVRAMVMQRMLILGDDGSPESLERAFVDALDYWEPNWLRVAPTEEEAAGHMLEAMRRDPASKYAVELIEASERKHRAIEKAANN